MYGDDVPHHEHTVHTTVDALHTRGRTHLHALTNVVAAPMTVSGSWKNMEQNTPRNKNTKKHPQYRKHISCLHRDYSMLLHSVQRSRLASRFAAAAWVHGSHGCPSSTCYLNRAASCQSNTTFSSLQEQDIAVFKSILGDTGVLTDDVALDAHNRYVPPQRCVLLPSPP